MLKKKNDIDFMYGESYAFQFPKTSDGNIEHVFVLELTGKRELGGGRYQETWNGNAIETKKLPLGREEAESLIRKYLNDLRPADRELTMELLCDNSPDSQA